MRGARSSLVALLLASCTGERTSAPPAAPTIDDVSVVAIPSNALGAIVRVRVQGADSVAVLFRTTAADSTADSVTPVVPVVGDTAAMPVLGLLPATPYVVRALARGPGGATLSGETGFTTDTLPSDLPSYVVDASDPAPGYVAFAAGKYGLVLDNSGRVVWYHRFEPNGPFLNFEAQPNGRYVGLPVTPDPSDVETFVEVDPLGVETRRLGCAGGLPTRFHDLIALPAGDYWIMCDEVRTMDLSALGGQAAARVMGTVVQHVAADGTLLFQWDPFDHFAITDLDSASRAGANVNWTHGNALAFDADGNLLVSFRSLNEITKIDLATGAVLWRMGGLRNEFTFEGTPMPAFARQHGLRLAGSGALLLVDNSGDPTATHAEEYVIDGVQHRATLQRSLSSIPAVVDLLGGSVQELPGGHVLVSFGSGGRVEEYDASGAVVWRIESPGYVFRAQRIRSLYQPGVGDPR
jgi:arylsulfotransferase ASST